MTTLNHFLEEGGIGDPDENLILAPGSSSQPSCQQDTAQSCPLARCEAQQTIPGREAPRVEVAGPASPELY